MKLLSRVATLLHANGILRSDNAVLRERLSSLERLIREVSRFVEDPERVR